MTRTVRTVLFLLLLIAAGASSVAHAQYFASSKSTKFHKETCQHVKNIKAENLIEFASVTEAKDAGYVPCKTCKPAGKSIRGENQSSGEAKDSDAGRCVALTRKGTRCKRNAQEGSSYCWQHGK